MTVVNLNLVLNSDQFYTGLDEICHRFDDGRSDEHLNALVEEVENAKGMLFQTIKKDMVKKGIKQESLLLRERLASATHYIDSHRFEPDEEKKASALALKQVFDSYSKPFARMKASERVGAMKTLQRDLDAPSMQEHVERLPEMASRINGMKEASETLKEALYQADKAKGTAPKGQSLMLLKREAAARLETLVNYLEVMAVKAPDDYAEHFAVVMQIINRLNARRKSKAYRINDDDLEEEITEEPEPSIEA